MRVGSADGSWYAIEIPVFEVQTPYDQPAQADIIPTPENLHEGTDSVAFCLPRREVRTQNVSVPFTGLTRSQVNDVEGNSYYEFRRTNGTTT